MSATHYTELIEPTSIQHCAAAYFSCAIAYAAQPQIVAVKGSFLEVYSVVQVRVHESLASTEHALVDGAAPAALCHQGQSYRQHELGAQAEASEALETTFRLAISAAYALVLSAAASFSEPPQRSGARGASDTSHDVLASVITTLPGPTRPSPPRSAPTDPRLSTSSTSTRSTARSSRLRCSGGRAAPRGRSATRCWCGDLRHSVSLLFSAERAGLGRLDECRGIGLRYFRILARRRRPVAHFWRSLETTPKDNQSLTPPAPFPRSPPHPARVPRSQAVRRGVRRDHRRPPHELPPHLGRARPRNRHKGRRGGAVESGHGPCARCGRAAAEGGRGPGRARRGGAAREPRGSGPAEGGERPFRLTASFATSIPLFSKRKPLPPHARVA